MRCAGTSPRRRGADVRWCGDLTEIPADEGKVLSRAILDLRSRRCVGFALGAHHDAEYTGECFAQACRRTGITQSMGRTGSALDNAVSESFGLHPRVRAAAR
jgi:transposase InsO family protein